MARPATRTITFLYLVIFLLAPTYAAAAPAPFPKPERICRHKHVLYGNWIEDRDTYEFFKHVGFAKPTAKNAVLRLAEDLDKDPTNAWTFSVPLTDLNDWGLNQPLNVTLIGMPPYYSEKYNTGKGTIEFTNDEPRRLIVKWTIESNQGFDKRWFEIKLIKGVPKFEKEIQPSEEVSCASSEACSTEALLDAVPDTSVDYSADDSLSVPVEDSDVYCFTEDTWEDVLTAESSSDSPEQSPTDEPLIDTSSTLITQDPVEEHIGEADYMVADPIDPMFYNAEVSEPYYLYRLPMGSLLGFDPFVGP